MTTLNFSRNLLLSLAIFLSGILASATFAVPQKQPDLNPAGLLTNWQVERVCLLPADDTESSLIDKHRQLALGTIWSVVPVELNLAPINLGAAVYASSWSLFDQGIRLQI